MGELVPKKPSSSFSRARAPLSRPSRASETSSVSEQMVAAGAEVLWQFGAVEGRLGSDRITAQMGREANRSIVDPKFDEPDQPILRDAARSSAKPTGARDAVSVD